MKEHIISLFPFNDWANRKLNWFGSVFPVEEIEKIWGESISAWITFSEKIDSSELEDLVIIKRKENDKNYSTKLKEIMLQLNYHSMHHHAQVNRIIRQQGQTPPITDYILTVLKEVK